MQMSYRVCVLIGHYFPPPHFFWGRWCIITREGRNGGEVDDCVLFLVKFYNFTPIFLI